MVFGFRIPTGGIWKSCSKKWRPGEASPAMEIGKWGGVCVNKCFYPSVGEMDLSLVERQQRLIW